MQRLEVSGAVRPLKSSLGVKGLIEWDMFRVPRNDDYMCSHNLYFN